MRHHLFIRILLSFAALMLVAVVWLAYDMVINRLVVDPWDQQYAWVDSKYIGVRSHVATYRNAAIDYTAEYPVTSSKAVNQVTAAAIDTEAAQFRQLTNGRAPFAGAKFRFNASYQITQKIGDIMSIEITTERDIGIGRPRATLQYWTFDLATGHIVTLSDIFGKHTTDGTALLVLLIQKAVVAKVQAKHPGGTATVTTDAINPHTITTFLLTSNNSLQFDFAPGVVAASQDGTLSVQIAAPLLDVYLQTPLANRLFSVQAVTTAPEYVPTTEQQSQPNCERLKCIALTFDDGPSSNTPKVLAALRDARAHATFFMIGLNIQKYPGMVNKIKQAGHTLGNHTWDHTSLTLLTSPQMTYEITRTNQLIERLSGTKPVYMRPPNGAVNTTLPPVLEQTGTTAIMWSVDTRDWATSDKNIIYNRVIAGAKPGAIVVMHEVRNTTVAALPRVLKGLAREGYTMVSLDELFGATGVPGKILTNAN